MTTMTQPTNELAAQPPQGKLAGLQTMDDSDFGNLLDTKRFEHIWRVASLFAKSDMVPEQYRNKPENCFIAIQMAVRLGVDPFMFMQNTYVVHGRPGMEAKLAIALINSSGLFDGPLQYEIDGEDAYHESYRVRAYATLKSNGKVMFGPWIDWKMVREEKWDSKPGSKWKTMAPQMFIYRAGMFFGRTVCPERLMGMQTVDELEDVGAASRRYVQNESTHQRGANGIMQRLKPAENETAEADAPSTEQPDEPEQQNEVPADEPARPAESDLSELGAKAWSWLFDQAVKGLAIKQNIEPEEVDADAARSAVLGFLGGSGMEVSELDTPEGRIEVKKAIKDWVW